MGDEPVYRGFLAIDVEGFSRSGWTDPIRAGSVAAASPAEMP